jgi:hypothetical protein
MRFDDAGFVLKFVFDDIFLSGPAPVLLIDFMVAFVPVDSTIHYAYQCAADAQQISDADRRF